MEKKQLNRKNNIALTINDLHICYRGLDKFSIRKFLFNKRRSNKKIPEAVSGVSLEIEKGKIIGIVGKNGSGKSTLLKAIAGVFSPDNGIIDLHNNNVSLLSMGVGFNKRLTGYENIYLSGMLLGFSESEIKKKEKQIIEFADIGSFMYKPVNTYSSGMHSKLSFAISAMLDTDIILIDEVLSVGDIQFREKSYDKMKTMILDDNKTVIIVSHSIQTLKELCDEVIWFHDGKIKKCGLPEEILLEYEHFMKNK